MCYEVLREIRRQSETLVGELIAVSVHPDVAELMNNEERPAVDLMVKRLHRGIEIIGRKGYHPEKFEIRGKKNR